MLNEYLLGGEKTDKETEQYWSIICRLKGEENQQSFVSSYEEAELIAKALKEKLQKGEIEYFEIVEVETVKTFKDITKDILK